MASLRIASCQLNLHVGDLSLNKEKILRAYKEALAADADIAVFSELAVCGYPPEDLLLKSGFVQDTQRVLNQIAKETEDCVAILGFIEGREAGADPLQRTSNAAAICSNGIIRGTYSKRALPDYGVFDEERYFAPGKDPIQTFKIRGIDVGVTICEDIWINNGVTSELAAAGAQIIVNLNASPYEIDKLETREEVLCQRIDETGVPIVYINQVGGQDELIFDGGSIAFDANKKIIARAELFQEEILIFDIKAKETNDELSKNVVTISENFREKFESQQTVRSLPSVNFQIWEALCLGTRDYLHKNGFSDICLGLSGGIDSAVVAAIACDALGPDHVHAILMPSRYSSDHSLDDAKALVENLGCDHMTIPIEPAHSAFLKMTEEQFSGLAADLTEENIQSRIRGILLMALSNKFQWLVLTTGNKSELAVGYSTLYGDTAGAFAVIKDLWKTQVFDLAKWKNETLEYELIPSSIITKPPSAELRPDQRDDQTLPPYDILDPLLRELIEKDKVPHELIKEGHDSEVVKSISRLVNLSEYKRRQSPLGPKISSKAFGRDRRVPITNSYKGT